MEPLNNIKDYMRDDPLNHDDESFAKLVLNLAHIGTQVHEILYVRVYHAADFVCVLQTLF